MQRVASLQFCREVLDVRFGKLVVRRAGNKHLAGASHHVSELAMASNASASAIPPILNSRAMRLANSTRVHWLTCKRPTGSATKNASIFLLVASSTMSGARKLVSKYSIKDSRRAFPAKVLHSIFVSKQSSSCSDRRPRYVGHSGSNALNLSGHSHTPVL
ncbi:hypothetical protein E4Q23_11795 [Candidatus Accumulibacter phosphatis]|mgnify:CR=1 FL=1|jgi:hypothetical protein|uniref:Mobile element protein n=1 Tax=Candidatus Accumulibacter phosphatis TaxID=327160 RepID=A0ABX1TVS3_9PROT|nr:MULTISPECIES: hypothetical protein [Candidatus Accumulibacter]NMQ28377.1 hypothetical protein [Candidatus Accumulibacter phosphatis]